MSNQSADKPDFEEQVQESRDGVLGKGIVGQMWLGFLDPMR